MKAFLVMFLCLLLNASDAAAARSLQFRGQFVQTYMAAEGFLDSLPKGVELACEDSLCSFSKAVRIYIFENNGRRQSFWSTDYCDVMFDEPERLLSCGDSGHVVYYDESKQLLLRLSNCDERELRYGDSLDVPSITAGYHTR